MIDWWFWLKWFTYVAAGIYVGATALLRGFPNYFGNKVGQAVNKRNIYIDTHSGYLNKKGRVLYFTRCAVLGLAVFVWGAGFVVACFWA